jgi:tetratricopeptide (TPR) repeat protein
MFGIAFVLLAMIQSAPPATPDEISDAIAHAEALYDAARFTEAITLLTRIDTVLSEQSGRLPEKVETKLHLALNNIGLNETDKAKSFLMALFALDPDYALDSQRFAPKVMAVATEAKTEQTKIWCYDAQTNARTYLDSGQTAPFLKLMQSAGSKCTVLATLGPQAAETFYRAGMDSFKRGDYSNALSSFQTALRFSPEHELARQYADLTYGKVQLGHDQSLVSGEYRKALTALVETWNRSCGLADAATMRALRGQISELLPDPSLGDDIRSKMKPCGEAKQAEEAAAPQPRADEPKPKSADSCIEMPSQVALLRVKTRIDPVITNDIRAFLQNNRDVMLRVKARISENGDVSVVGMPDGHPALSDAIRRALVRWKFAPIRDESGPRCANTEIPFTLKLGQ